jgi:hypothetical protein
MKVSLAALHTACAVASSAFGFDTPPIIPPHAPAATAVALQQSA